MMSSATLAKPSLAAVCRAPQPPTSTRTSTTASASVSTRRGRINIASTRTLAHMRAGVTSTATRVRQQPHHACRSSGNDDATSVAVEDVTNGARSAADTVRAYYAAVNKRDLRGALSVVADNVVYEDLALYPKGLEGKFALQSFLSKWCKFPADVEFLIDEMVEGDRAATAVTWHLEVAGKPMPFSRGVSFYRVDEMGLLCFGRDLVEPAVKSGGGGVAALKALFPLIRSMSKQQALGFVPPLPQALPAEEGDGAAAMAARRFYTASNERDIEGAVNLMATDVAYEDLQLFSDALLGHAAVREMFDDWGELEADVLFVVDDVTQHGEGAAGVLWHLEVGGIPMPFSRGCSFYRFNAEGKVQYARDLVEPLLKPGDAGMSVMGAVFPLVRRLPAGMGLGLGLPATKNDTQALAVDTSNSPESLLLWFGYSLYWGIVLLGHDVPGIPLQETQWETIDELLGQSLNFFFVNPAMHSIGITLIPSPASHPVNEALFNFVNAWSLMFLPVVLSDARAAAAGVDRLKWWLGQFFLTNIFFIPFMALRARAPPAAQLPPPAPPATPAAAQPLVNTVVGGVGAIMAAVCVGWAAVARPEFGGLEARVDHFTHLLVSDRVYFAFVLDMVLYSAFQSKLLGDAMAPTSPNRWLRWVPFFGLAGWLLAGDGQDDSDTAGAAP